MLLLTLMLHELHWSLLIPAAHMAFWSVLPHNLTPVVYMQQLSSLFYLHCSLLFSDWHCIARAYPYISASLYVHYQGHGYKIRFAASLTLIQFHKIFKFTHAFIHLCCSSLALMTLPSNCIPKLLCMIICIHCWAVYFADIRTLLCWRFRYQCFLHELYCIWEYIQNAYALLVIYKLLCIFFIILMILYTVNRYMFIHDEKKRQYTKNRHTD